jgi:TP901 family phage tail tape measure protein
MANPIRVVLVGDTASLEAALGSASGTLDKFGETADAVFGEYSTAALRAQVATDRLAVSLAKVPAGSTAAAAAVSRYRGEIDSLQASQVAAAREVGTSLTKYITVPAIAVGAASVDLATKFQSAMLRIQTQAGASGAEVKKMTSAILDLAKSGAQQGPVQLAEALYPIESVGIRGARALDALNVASKAAALGGASLGDVADVLSAAIKTNIKGTQDFQQAMGTLNATVGAGKMTMQDLAGALGTGLLLNAKLVGLSLDQVGAALDVLVDRGMPATQAATRLGATFKLMYDPSGLAVKALAQMGISASQLAVDLRQPNGLLTALTALRQGYEALGPVAGGQALASAFGRSRQSTAIIGLVEALPSYIAKLKQVHDTQMNLTQDEMLQQQTAAASFHRDLAAMEADLVGLGNAILPTVTTVVNGVTKIGSAFSHLPGPIKDDLGVIVGILAVGGPLMIGIAAVSKAVTAMGTAFEMFGLKAKTSIATTDAEMTTMATTAGTTAGVVEADNVAEGASFSRLGGLVRALGLVGGVVAVGQTLGSLYNRSGLNHTLNELTGNTATIAQLRRDKDPFAQAALRSIEARAAAGDKTAQAMLASPSKPLPAFGRAGFDLTSEITQLLALGKGHAALVPGVLTAAQRMQIGLAANPDNPALLHQEAQGIEGEIAWLQKRLREGKITPAAYTAHMTALETELYSLDTKATTGENKAAAARRKAAAAAARAQRLYASGVSTHAEDLRATALKDRGLPFGPGGALPHQLTAADAALIAYYREEAKNSKLTAAERARYRDLAAAARQQEAAEATRDKSKAQRLYASSVSTHAEDLKTTALKFRALPTAAGGQLPSKLTGADDALILYYEREAKDSKLTAAERARYHNLAVAARQQEASQAARDAESYERARVDAARAAYDAIRGVKGTVPQQEAALRREIGVYDTAIHNKNLTATERGSLITGRGTAMGALARLRSTYTVPQGLQLQYAQDTANQNIYGVYTDARKIKDAALNAIEHDHLTKQAMIDAWNEIAQMNQTLGTNQPGYRDVGAYKLVQGLAFASDLDKRIAEARIAQAMQHQGRVPIGLGAEGFTARGTRIELHSTVELDGRAVGKSVQSHLVGAGGTGSGSTRTGRLPGVRAGLA